MHRTSIFLFSTLILASSLTSAQELHTRNQAPTPSNPQEQNIPPQQDKQDPANGQQPWAAQQSQANDPQAQSQDSQPADTQSQDAQQDPQPLQPPAAAPAQAAQSDDTQAAEPAEPPAATEERQTIARNAIAHTYGSASYPNEVPDGFRFLVTLAEPLDTASVARGKHFRALLREPLVAPNGQAITGGRWITGHVSEVQRGFNAMLLLSFDEIQTTKGWIPLSATVVEVPSEHGLKAPGSEGEIQRRPLDMRKTLEGAGVGAVVGASTGEAAGGGRGAAVGAATGAVAGAGVATLTDRDILLDRGAQLVLRLDRGVIIP